MKRGNNKRNVGYLTLIVTLALLLLSFLVACGNLKASVNSGENDSSNISVSEDKQEKDKQKVDAQNEDTQKNEKVTLYFSDKDVNYMLKENRIIYYNDDKTVEDAIVEALIEGPKAEGRYRAILSTVKLIGTRVEDGICYMELSKEFFNENAQGTAGGGMALGTLVNSLLDRDNIEGVVLIYDGEAVQEYGGHFGFDGPIDSPMGTIKEDGLEDMLLRIN